MPSLSLPNAAVAVCFLIETALAAAPAPLRGWSEVGHEQVELGGRFWGPRLATQHRVTVPHALNELEKDGHVTNFDKAAGKFDGPLKGHHAFDSDLHKALEGALMSLEHFEDPPLRRRVDDILARILAAQQADGFLISYFIVNGLDQRWDDLRLRHQMYNAGHFFEMAVAHHQLTGDARVLNAAKRFADHIDATFGPNKRYDVDGHQEVELALVKLFRATGERRYLDLAKFFLDERGHAHGSERKPLDPSSQSLPNKPEGNISPEQQREFWHARLRLRNGRMQDHKPVVDQHEAVGHAVRAGYMYAAMADCVRFMEAPGYEAALDNLWKDAVGKKIYLTGGVGTAQYHDEGFGDPYLLPNESAYCESCAAIAHVLWQARMNLLKQDAKYADLLELTLYNGALSGISLAGDAFFYQNPLASTQGEMRRRWIGLSCCPTNLTRFLPQVGGWFYATGPNRILVNLYGEGRAAVRLDGGATVRLTQQTDYPWDGTVRMGVALEQAKDFTLALRIPGWARGRLFPSDLYQFCDESGVEPGLMVNGKDEPCRPGPDGYVRLQRKWQDGDTVELRLPMPVRRVHAHPLVKDDAGKVALVRGPVVYCVEGVDHPGLDVMKMVLPADAGLRAVARPELLGGTTVIAGKARNPDGGDTALLAVPSALWQNRGKSPMTVWLRETP